MGIPRNGQTWKGTPDSRNLGSKFYWRKCSSAHCISDTIYWFASARAGLNLLSRKEATLQRPGEAQFRSWWWCRQQEGVDGWRETSGLIGKQFRNMRRSQGASVCRRPVGHWFLCQEDHMEVVTRPLWTAVSPRDHAPWPQGLGGTPPGT